MGEEGRAHELEENFAGKPKGQRTIRRSGQSLEDNIKRDLKVLGC
jgi:hypothetical protein